MIKGAICVLSLTAVVLAILVYVKINKSCGSGTKANRTPATRALKARAMRALGMDPNSSSKNVKFVPSGSSGGSWPSPDDVGKCQSAFGGVDATCQANPNSDKIACSDYPMVYCDGALQASGDMNFGGCVTGAVAYNIAECSAPRTVSDNGAYLCGGNVDPCVDKEKTGMNCKAPAPPNPWGATNICYPG